MESTDKIFSAELKKELHRRGSFCNVLCLEQAESTNLTAKELIKGGEAEGDFAVIAREQTKGRGSHERSFFSYTGGLYLSFVPGGRFAPSEILKLTPYTAVVEVEAIEKIFGVRTGIKWVNDIIYRNKKLSGILVEAVDVGDGFFRAIIGIGINLFKPPQGFDKELSQAIWLTDEADEGQKAALCAELTAKLSIAGELIKSRNVFEKYASYSAITGKTVSLIKDSVNVSAKVIGTDECGGLILRFENGEEEILRSGSITVDWSK